MIVYYHFIICLQKELLLIDESVLCLFYSISFSIIG